VVAREIRLLTLLPEAFPSEIHILLDETPFIAQNMPTCEALSYTWGSPEDPISIKVGTSEDNNLLLVTQNLAAALKYFRLKDKARVLWIDAICVNQENLKERSHQVQRMGDIYKAERVVVWLGPEWGRCSLAIKLLRELALVIEVNWFTYAWKPVSNDATEKN
jgi:hypothetical protein